MNDRAFARAFVAMLQELPESAHVRACKKLAQMLASRGEPTRGPQLFTHIEEAYARVHGGRTIVIETARPLTISEKKKFSAHTSDQDIVRYIVRADVIAGSRITINDSRVIDCSLAGRLARTENYGA